MFSKKRWIGMSRQPCPHDHRPSRRTARSVHRRATRLSMVRQPPPCCAAMASPTMLRRHGIPRHAAPPWHLGHIVGRFSKGAAIAHKAIISFATAALLALAFVLLLPRLEGRAASGSDVAPLSSALLDVSEGGKAPAVERPDAGRNSLAALYRGNGWVRESESRRIHL